MEQAITREAVAAQLQGEPPLRGCKIAMGFTANVDLLLAGGPVLTARMRRWRAAASAAEAAVWQAILDEQARCVASGRGGELTIEPAGVLRRLDAYGYAMTSGGTGVRAAAQAARLGQRAIVSIPAADPRLASLLSDPLLSLISTPSPVPATCPPVHYIIELPDVASDKPAAPSGDGWPHAWRANRLIVHGEETWSPLLPDPFIAPIAEAVPPARLLLLSGFNIYAHLPALDRALAHAKGWLQAVRQRVPQLWIYLEMAGYATPAALRRVLEMMSPLVDAVGMNEDECALALDLPDPMRQRSPSAQLAILDEVLTCYPVDRLVVHTRWASTYVGRVALAPGERVAAARALAWGNTAAGFRYVYGCDGSRRALRGAAGAWTLAPEGVSCAVAAVGRRDMVLIPAWHLRQGAGNIGLGDAFTGAFLTGLDPPAPCADAPR